MKTKMESNKINFIPEFIYEEKERKKRMLIVTLSTLSITLFCFSIYFIPQFKLFSLSNKLDNHSIELKYREEEQKLLNEIKANEANLSKKQRLVEEIEKDEFNISALMDKLNGVNSEEVIFSYFSVNGTNVNVKYTVNNPVQINQLVESLRRLDIFEKVTRPSIPIMDRKTDVVFNLTLKADFINQNKVKS